MSITDILNSSSGSSITDILNGKTTNSGGGSQNPIIALNPIPTNFPTTSGQTTSQIAKPGTPSFFPADLAVGTAQGIARTVASVGMSAGNAPTDLINNSKLGLDKQSLPFNQSIPTKDNPITSAIFGGQPVQTVQKNIADTQKTLEPYIGKTGSNLSATTLVLGSIALDLSGFGGGKAVTEVGQIPEKFFSTMAKESNPGVIEGTLRSVGIDETIAKNLAPKFAETRTTQEAKDVLLNFGKNETVSPTNLLKGEITIPPVQSLAPVIVHNTSGEQFNIIKPGDITSVIKSLKTGETLNISNTDLNAKFSPAPVEIQNNESYNKTNETTNIYNKYTGQDTTTGDKTSVGGGSEVPKNPQEISTNSTEESNANTVSKTIVPDIVGERNVRIAGTNQLRQALQKTLTTQEQEALTFYRDFKDNPQGLQQLSTDPTFEKYKGLINLAANPTPAMLNADKVITGYFGHTLEEGKNLGFLDSNIQSDKYITHLLAPSDVPSKTGLFGGAKISRSTQFAKTRTYETVADAIKAGVKVKSLNALDALTIYGDKHAVAASTKIGLILLKESGVGKFGYKGADNIPKDWVVADPSNKFFRNTVPFTTPEGKPSFAYQDLYVPPQIAKAIKPLIFSDFTGQIPGFTKSRLFQSYIKTVQLGLSVFHLKAMNITALNNEGVTGLVQSYAKSMTSPEFLESEKDFVLHGGMSPILGQTMEAYIGLTKTSIPSRLDILKKVTGIQAVDNFSKKLTKLTFDITQRKFKVQDYALKTAKFIAKNPNVTDEALTTAKRALAAEVNAAYGGLNWEMLGWNKATLNISRFLMLAPDWTFSNVFNAKYAFEAGPAGNAARMFWIRSIITGAALTYGISTIINNKPQKANFQNFTNVNLGKDKSGKDIYQNMFFAGAPNDAINLMNNIVDYGFIQGFIQFLASKASPAIRTIIQMLTNRNYIGQQIVPKGIGVVAGTARSLYTLVVGISPVPFTVSTIASMMLDPNNQYTKEEYLTALAGTRPRHVIPDGLRQVPSGSKKGQLVPSTVKTENSFINQVLSGKQYQSKVRGSGEISL